ncbi:MAG: N-acetyltransferase family protein [Parvibaculum sp.]
MKNPFVIRRAEGKDLVRLTEIYNHYIVHAPSTFDIEPKTLEQRGEWLAQFGPTGRHQCFVAEVPGNTQAEVQGWACSGPYRPKAAYETSVETSVYVAHDAKGKGMGRAMYEELLAALRKEDVHRALAGITQPNDASMALHRRIGFEAVGIYTEVGRKFGRYWDVLWMELKL